MPIMSPYARPFPNPQLSDPNFLPSSFNRPLIPLFNTFSQEDYEWVATALEQIDHETRVLIAGMFADNHAARVLQAMAAHNRE
jgi:hypothetical protein